ncbi:MAG: hypothetical protein R3D67_07665 [Hyphomicrobiaceae bacterium]
MSDKAVLVKVHATCAAGAIAAALRVTVPAARFGAAAPLPSPVQLIAVTDHPVAAASVIVVEVPGAVSHCCVPLTGTPEVAVVMFWLVQPLLPVKVNVPVAPLLTFEIVRRGGTSNVRFEIPKA